MTRSKDPRSVTIRFTEEEMRELNKLSEKLRYTKVQLLKEGLKSQQYKLDQFYDIKADIKEEAEKLRRVEILNFYFQMGQILEKIGITPEVLKGLNKLNMIEDMIEDMIEGVNSKLDYLISKIDILDSSSSNINGKSKLKIPEKIIGSQPSGHNLSKFGINIDYDDPLPPDDGEYLHF